MIGRRGAVTEEARAALDDFAARGVEVLARACDVTDRQALEKLLEIMHATMPPAAGVIHAAMVLDDGILANLDAERFRRVLAPKVAGAENLDNLLRGEPLEYFVLYSSVTTLIGNPGQANYVAANAYLEGLARRRRQNGLPALAIAWGPILDVGVVAQNQRLQKGLQQLTGIVGMEARQALVLLEQALKQPSAAADLAVMTVVLGEGTFSADRLPVLRSPTYEDYISAGRKAREVDAERIDLHALAAKDGVEAVRGKVAEVIVIQLARVLHMREQDISRVRPLGEIGLDSLMALELVMNLEECFGLKIPMAGASGGMTIADIADQIIAHVGLDEHREDAAALVLADQHQAAVEPAQLAVLKDIMDEEVRAPKRLLS
jgi:acyl carrier protein/NAD(P)-dependent dehydrogenase (short-subunit alcohol dehydrogenase family)